MSTEHGGRAAGGGVSGTRDLLTSWRLATGLVGGVLVVTAVVPPWGTPPVLLAVAALTVVAGLVLPSIAPRLVAGRWRDLAPAVAGFLPVLVLHLCDGPSGTSYPGAVLVPVLWLATRRSLRAAAVAVLGAAVVLLGPGLWWLFRDPTGFVDVGGWRSPLQTLVVAAVVAVGARRAVAAVHRRESLWRDTTDGLTALGAHAATRDDVCQAVARTTGAAVVLLVERGPGGPVTTGRSAAVLGTATAVPPGARGGGALATALSGGRRVLVADPSTDPGGADRLAAALSGRSVLYQPVPRPDGAPVEGAAGAAASTTVGVLVLVYREPVAEPDPDQAGLLDVVATGVASTVSRIDLLAELDVLAGTDPLTGLGNRRSWDEALAAATGGDAGAGPLSVLLIDLDGFKSYNDAHGHPAGDELLRAFAAAVARCVRDGDRVFRLGGDEFAVLLPGCAADAARTVGETVRARVPDGVTCSVGAAGHRAGAGGAELVARADRALYASKSRGGNRVSDADDLDSPVIGATAAAGPGHGTGPDHGTGPREVGEAGPVATVTRLPTGAGRR